jgi:hypothetical protein
LSDEDKLEMARSRVGYGTWEETSEELRQKFIEMEVWKAGVFENWLKEKEEEEARKMNAKISKKGKKKARRQVVDDSEDEYEFME